MQGRRAGHQLRNDRCCSEDVLEVVEHEEKVPVGEVRAESLHDRTRRHPLLAHAEDVRDRRRNEGGVLDRGELHEEHAVGIAVAELRGDAYRESRLPGPTRTGERDQSRALEKFRDHSHLLLAADETGDLGGKVRRNLERSRLGKVARQALDLEVAQVLRMREVLQPVAAEIAKSNAARKIVLHEGARGAGEDHLPAVRRRRDARRRVDVDAEVVVASEHALAGVQTHPHPEGSPVAPRVLREAVLSGGRGAHGRGRTRKHREERVALRADLDAVAPRDRGAEDLRVVVLDVPIALTELLEQARGALDVGEHEGHGADGQSRSHERADSRGRAHRARARRPSVPPPRLRDRRCESTRRRGLSFR